MIENLFYISAGFKTCHGKIVEQPVAAIARCSTGEVIAFTPVDRVENKVEILKKVPNAGSNSIKLEDAEVIAAGGRGMGSQENFDKLAELAGLF